jgi:hypothetical protein
VREILTTRSQGSALGLMLDATVVIPYSSGAFGVISRQFADSASARRLTVSVATARRSRGYFQRRSRQAVWKHLG